LIFQLSYQMFTLSQVFVTFLAWYRAGRTCECSSQPLWAGTFWACPVRWVTKENQEFPSTSEHASAILASIRVMRREPTQL
jgi:hypothetical protein